MKTQSTEPDAASQQRRSKRRSTVRSIFNRLVENDLVRKVSFETYRDKVRDVYDGPKGTLLSTMSMLSLHMPLGERLFRSRAFDLSGCKDLLDVGSGAGQILQHVLRYSDDDARVTALDLSFEMIRRARHRLKKHRPGYLVAGLPSLPFADNSFDCLTCGYVLEHLPDARVGLEEMARIMRPGARMLLLTSEDNFGGAWTSRFWYCRTYNREELRQVCTELGLTWVKELWLSKVHELLRAGGICVELRKDA